MVEIFWKGKKTFKKHIIKNDPHCKDSDVIYNGALYIFDKELCNMFVFILSNNNRFCRLLRKYFIKELCNMFEFMLSNNKRLCRLIKKSPKSLTSEKLKGYYCGSHM